MTIPSTIISLIKPGTEGFIEKYAQSKEDIFRMVAEDRLRNAMMGGDVITAQQISTQLLSAAITEGSDESYRFIEGLMTELGCFIKEAA